MKRSFLAGLFGGMVALSPGLRSQETPTLTLDQAVALAIDVSPDLRAIVIQENSSVDAFRWGLRDYLPKVGLNYSKKLYDDRGSFIKSPTLKDVAMTGVGIAATLATGGLGAVSILASAAATTAMDAVFTTADVAHGADAGQEWGAFSKRAAITGATTAFSFGVGALGSVAGQAIGTVAGDVGVGISKAVQAGVTAGGSRLISTAVNSIDWQNGHLGFDSNAFGNAWDTSNISNYSGIMTAMAGSIGGSLGTSFGGSLEGLTKWNTKLTGAIGNDVGMIAGQAVGYGASMVATTIQNGGFSQNTWGQSLDNMGGLNANLVNAGMLLQMAGGAMAMTSGNKYNPDDYKGLYEAAGKLSNTGLFEVSLNSGGASGSFSGGGVNLGGAVWDTAQYGYGQANIEAQLKNMTQSDARQTLTDLYSNGDYAAEALVNRLGAGIDKIRYGSISDSSGNGNTMAGEAQTTTDATGRVITLDNRFQDSLGHMGAIVMSHEAWRSGTVADAAMQQAKTDDAVLAHTKMAMALRNQYNDNSIILGNTNLTNDVVAMMNATKNGTLSVADFNTYVQKNYDSSADYWKVKKDGSVVDDGSGDIHFEDGRDTIVTGKGRQGGLQAWLGISAEQATTLMQDSGFTFNGSNWNQDSGKPLKTTELTELMKSKNMNPEQVLGTNKTLVDQTAEVVVQGAKLAWSGAKAVGRSVSGVWTDTFAGNPETPGLNVPGQAAYDPTKPMSLANPPREDFLGTQLGAPTAADSWKYCAVDALVFAGINYGGNIPLNKTANLMTSLSNSGAFGLDGQIQSPEAWATIIKLTAAVNGVNINPSVGTAMKYSDYLASGQFDAALLEFSSTGNLSDVGNSGHYEFQRKQGFLVGSKQVDPAAGDYGKDYKFTGYVRPIKKNG